VIIKKLQWEARRRKTDAGAWIALAQACHQGGREAQALNAAREGARWKLDVGQARTLGQLLERLDDRSAAVDVYKGLLRERPGDFDTTMACGRLMLQLGKREQANEMGRRACDQRPGSGDAHMLWAEVLVARGDKSGAATHLREARNLGVATEARARLEAMLSRVGGVVEINRPRAERVPTSSAPPRQRLPTAPPHTPPPGPPVVITAALGLVPLRNWVQAFAESTLTGTLHLFGPWGEAEMDVLEGQFAGARSSVTPNLGTLLVRAGRLERDALRPLAVQGLDDGALAAHLALSNQVELNVLRATLYEQVFVVARALGGHGAGAARFMARDPSQVPGRWRQVAVPPSAALQAMDKPATADETMPGRMVARQRDGGGEADTTFPALAARGELGSLALPTLLALLGPATGALRLVSSEGVGEIHLVEGSVVGAACSAAPRLGDLLVQARLMDADELAPLLREQAHAATPALLGRMIRAAGLLTAGKLHETLTLQVQGTLRALGAWRTGRFAFDREAPGMDPERLGDLHAEDILVQAGVRS
jgi:tetratricopeptide (TPR) repeat protein